MFVCFKEDRLKRAIGKESKGGHMIPSIRVDDRLIHGQVALVWSKELNCPRIVVANDAAAVNDVTKMTLQMATPTGIKLLIKSVDDCIKVFNDPRAKDMRMFVLTNNVADALRIVKECPGLVESVNVANVGRFDDTDKSLMVQVTPQCILNPDELEALRELAKQDVSVYGQIIPTDPKTPASKMLASVES